MRFKSIFSKYRIWRWFYHTHTKAIHSKSFANIYIHLYYIVYISYIFWECSFGDNLSTNFWIKSKELFTWKKEMANIFEFQFQISQIEFFFFCEWLDQHNVVVVVFFCGSIQYWQVVHDFIQSTILSISHALNVLDISYFIWTGFTMHLSTDFVLITRCI